MLENGWKMDGRWIDAFPQFFFQLYPATSAAGLTGAENCSPLAPCAAVRGKEIIKAEYGLVFASTRILCACRCSVGI